jgi:integrase
VDRDLRALFKEAGVECAHAHRFRHTLATELLGRGASFEDVADIRGNSPDIARKHYTTANGRRRGNRASMTFADQKAPRRKTRVQTIR